MQYHNRARIPFCMLIKRNSNYDAHFVSPSGSPSRLSTIHRAKLNIMYNDPLYKELVLVLTTNLGKCQRGLVSSV